MHAYAGGHCWAASSLHPFVQLASEQAQQVPTLLQAESERTRKALHKAEHDVERLRRALDRSEEQHRSAESRAAAATQSLQVCCCPVPLSSACSRPWRAAPAS